VISTNRSPLYVPEAKFNRGVSTCSGDGIGVVVDPPSGIGQPTISPTAVNRTDKTLTRFGNFIFILLALQVHSLNFPFNLSAAAR
jgi:hypothetical protein